MKEIQTDKIKINRALPNELYHHSGEVLCNKGFYITKDIVDIMNDLGIAYVYELEKNETPMIFKIQPKKIKITLDEIEIGKPLQAAVFNNKNKVVLAAGLTPNEKLLEDLERRQMNPLYIKKSKLGCSLKQVQEFRTRSENKKIDISKLDSPEFSTENFDFITDIRKVYSEINSKRFDPSLITDVYSDKPPLKFFFDDVDYSKPKTDIRLKYFLSLYNDCLVSASEIYSELDKKVDVSSEIYELCKNIIAAIMSDNAMMLNLTRFENPDDFYLPRHALNVTIYSITMAAALNYCADVVFETAIGALLHDIGMLSLPKLILEKKTKLTDREKREIQKHPQYGLERLSKLKVPRSCAYIIGQCHERENALGYPHQRSSDKIHPLTKIVAVADMYDALISNRNYRAPIPPYKAMETLLVSGGKRLIDASVVRSLLSKLSLFPIGSFVELSNGTIGRVICANEKDYTSPIVAEVLSPEGIRLEYKRHDLMKSPEIKIVKAINGNNFNLDIVDGF